MAPGTHRHASLRTQWRERLTADPRPDLAADSLLWERVLGLAYEYDGAPGVEGTLFAALLQWRICGGALRIDPENGLTFECRFDPTSNTEVWWDNKEHYARDFQEMLQPHGTLLGALLRDVLELRRLQAPGPAVEVAPAGGSWDSGVSEVF